jgi:hypothetical protein
MSPFAVQLLRRVSSLAALGALLLLAVPWALTWAGLIGPTPQEDIAGAERALLAARSYGAGHEETSFKAGGEEVARARRLLAAGRTREARQAAARARSLGIEAQRAALGAREASRRRAEAAAAEIDGLLNELEELFDQNTRGLPPGEQTRLLSVMKESRQAGGGVLLAFNQGQFARVLEQEAACRETLQRTRRQLLEAGKPRPPSS